jgi:hypothetical protein
MSNTPEHRTIIHCTPELTAALKHDLISLSGELLAAGLISDDNYAALCNQFISVADRAAQLAGFVRNRVLLDIVNYHSFIRVLKQREDDHYDILQCLYKKYRELGGHGMYSSSFMQTTVRIRI